MVEGGILIDLPTLRLLDANLNRALEGLRVLEDLARFVLSDPKPTGKLKRIRHLLSQIPQQLGTSGKELAISRKSAWDVGQGMTTKSELTRHSWESILAANSKRVGEAMRVLEESAKLVSGPLARRIKEARYLFYDAETDLSQKFNQDKKLDFDLYVVTNRGVQRGRSHLRVIRDAISGGARAIQLRDKTAKLGEFYREAKGIAQLCKKHGVTFIVNDYIDICRAVDADGVHLGQEDMPVGVARRVLGPDKILGYSTHDREQAKLAERGGADYVSLGPIFETPSKEGWKPRGLPFIRWAARNLKIPFVAIGGIDSYNIRKVVAAGASRVAVIRAAVQSRDVAKAVRELRRGMGQFRHPERSEGSHAGDPSLRSG